VTFFARALRAPSLWGLVLGVGVCFPWFRPGRLLLLDWVVGPHTALVPREAFGLDGGVVNGLPWHVVSVLLSRVLGGPATWLPLLLFYPLATTGVARLLRHAGVGAPGQLVAAALFCVNPWVIERVSVGHVGLVLGYAVLPHAVLSMLRGAASGWWAGLGAGLWTVVLIAFSAHFAWILIPVFGALIAVRGPRLAHVRWAVLAVAVTCACSLYVVATPLLAGRHGSLPAAADLAAYRTRGSDDWHALGNVVGLYGFWRPSGAEPRILVAGWPFLLVAILAVVLVGYLVAIRDRARVERREIAMVMLVLIAAGVLLAMGDRGPTGPGYRFLYQHVSAFRLMREPQKFSLLVALGYACGLGLGVDWLLRSLHGARRRLGALVLLGVVLAYGATAFGGLAGSLSVTRDLPALTAADVAMGKGQGSALVLPWHLYLAFEETDRRVIANPAGEYLRRTVLSGHNAELAGVSDLDASAQSRFVEQLIAQGDAAAHFGQDVASMGVTFVVLVHTADWRSYSWLERRPDLRLVRSGPDFDVWAAPVPGPTGLSLRRISPVEYQIERREAGRVVLPEPFDAGWRLESLPAEASREGGVVLQAPAGGSRARYVPWRRVLWCDVLSLLATVAALLAMGVRYVTIMTVRRGLRS